MVTSSVPIKIIGPELTQYYTTYQVYNDLTDVTKPACNILPYIDIFSLHLYPFGNQNKPQTNFDVPALRDNVIQYLSGIPSPAQFANLQNTNPYRNVLSEIRTRLNNNGGSAVEIAITEANICHMNDVPGDNGTTSLNNLTVGADDLLTGTGANSFIAGQFWAEFMTESMRANNPMGTNAKLKFLNFWSIKEGAGPNYEGNIGYLNNDPNKFGGVGGKKPTYWHFQLMAQNFNGTFFENTFTTNNQKLKAYAYQNSTEIGVLLMNQYETAPPLYGHNFNISFDNGTTAGNASAPFQVNLDMAIANSYNCYIKTESTVLLKFNATTGDLISRTEYNIEDAGNNVGPKTWIPSGAPDAYIRDTPSDDGNMPSQGAPWHLVEGKDVWVRNSPDQLIQSTPTQRFANEHAHQSINWINNTHWQTQANRPRIYVKVRNRGCSPVNGRVRLYYNKAGLNDTWPTNWKQIYDGDPNGDGVEDFVSPAHDVSLQAGEETVLEVIWNNTADPAEFFQPFGTTNQWCLLARFGDGNDPIITTGSSAEQTNVPAVTNAQLQNNIVQKNVIFVPPPANNHCFPVNFGNVSTTTTYINKLELVDDANQDFVGKETDVFVDLGETIYNAWVLGGKMGSGIVDGASKYLHVSPSGNTHSHAALGLDRKPYQIKVTNKNAYLSNLILTPGQFQPLCFSFNYYPTARTLEGPLPSTFIYSARQFQSQNLILPDYKFTGAELFYIEPVACGTVSAGEDQTIGANCSAELAANPDLRGHRYYWRNNTTGEIIGEGSNIIVTPSVTTTYELEKIDFQGCYSYDVVTVNVTSDLPPCAPPLGRMGDPNMSSENESILTAADISFSAYPNPFKDQLTILYQLPEKSKEGLVKIYEAASGKLVYQHTLNVKDKKLILNQFDVAAGLYICHIIADDGTSKQFKLVNIK